MVWLAGAWEAWRLPRARWLLAPAVAAAGLHGRRRRAAALPAGDARVLYAVGCLPLSRWVGDHAWRRVLVVGLIGLNAVVSMVVALPVVPVTVLGGTPLPDLSILVADQVGWPRYVAQVAQVASQTDDPGAVVITSNYGEAGAVARYGPALGLPAPYSGQNDLGTGPGPPEGTRTVVFVGWQLPGRGRARSPPARCWPGSTTAWTSTTRSRARRWPCAATRCCRGHSSGPGSLTSTEGTPTIADVPPRTRPEGRCEVAHPQWVEARPAVAGIRGSGHLGMSTPSMTWMTPLLASTSVVVTFTVLPAASVRVTLSPSTPTVSSPPWTVLTFWPSSLTTSAAMALPGTTW